MGGGKEKMTMGSSGGTRCAGFKKINENLSAKGEQFQSLTF